MIFWEEIKYEWDAIKKAIDFINSRKDEYANSGIPEIDLLVAIELKKRWHSTVLMP